MTRRDTAATECGSKQDFAGDGGDGGRTGSGSGGQLASSGDRSSSGSGLQGDCGCD